MTRLARVLPAAPCPSASGAHAQLLYSGPARHPSRSVSGRMDYRTKVQAALTGTRSLERSRTSARACMRTKTRQMRWPRPELTTGCHHFWRAVARKTRAQADPRREGRLRVTRQFCPWRGSGRAALAVGPALCLQLQEWARELQTPTLVVRGPRGEGATPGPAVRPQLCRGEAASHLHGLRDMQSTCQPRRHDTCHPRQPDLSPLTPRPTAGRRGRVRWSWLRWAVSAPCPVLPQ